MKYSVEVRPADRCAIVSMDGPFSPSSLADAYARIVAHPGWESSFHMVVVIGPGSDLQSTSLSAMQAWQAEVRVLNARHRTGIRLRTALVCTSELKRVIADLWVGLVGSDWEVELGIFTSLDEALEWLSGPTGDAEASQKK